MRFVETLRKPWVWLLMLILYLLMIFAVSNLSAQQLRQVPFTVWDKFAHFLEYSPVGFAIAGWLHTKWREIKFIKIVPVTVGLVAILGGLDELHQSFIPGREVSMLDVLADTVGALAGALGSCFFFRSVRQRSTSLNTR